MSEMLPIEPVNLLIDELNPRLSSPNAGQRKALRALATYLKTKLSVLAADIVQYGPDPSTLPIVIPLAGRSGRYVVLEGNRRLAALMVLENPDSIVDAVTPAVLKQIRKLSKVYQANPVETLLCIVMKDRDEAKHWIELRHTGELSGAGIVRWNADESNRFGARSGTPPPHIQVLDFLQRRGDLTDEARSRVPTSTLGRIVGSPPIRAKLGLEVDKKVIYLLADEAPVAKALMHVIHDLTSGNKNVGDLYDKEDRARYAAEFPANLTVRAKVKSGQGIAAAAAGTGTAPKPAKRAKRLPKKRDKLIPADCVLAIPNGRLREIEIELRKLSLENHTNAISVLFRVFFELSVDTYNGKNLPLVREESTLRIKTEAAVTHLVDVRKKLVKKQAHAVLAACQKNTFLAASVVMMNQYVHNPFVFPAPDDLRAQWNSFQPFVTALWAP